MASTFDTINCGISGSAGAAGLSSATNPSPQALMLPLQLVETAALELQWLRYGIL